MTDLPIACTLSPDTMTTRRAGLLPGLAARAQRREDLPGGVRLQFAPSGETLAAIAATIDAERQCCRFLTFDLHVEAGEGPIALSVTGPAGTHDFLQALLDA